MRTYLLLILALVFRRHQAVLNELAYARAEVDYYKSQMPKKPRFTPEWRRTFAELGEKVGWVRLRELATVARAKTIQGWARKLRGGVVVGAKKFGRPRISKTIEALIVRLAKENPSWGQRRIKGVLRKEGIRVAARTIAAVLKRNGLPPGPRRESRQTWKPFVMGNLQEIVATDFFTTKVWGWTGLKEVYVLFFIHLGSRRVHIAGITDHPNEAFMKQTARDMTGFDGWVQKVGARYVVHDRDAKYCAEWRHILEDADLDMVPSSYSAPNMNAFAERWVHSVKSECLDRLTIVGMSGLRRALREYVVHYHGERPHQGLPDDRVPFPQTETGAQKVVTGDLSQDGPVLQCRERLGGVLKHYERVAG